MHYTWCAGIFWNFEVVRWLVLRLSRNYSYIVEWTWKLEWTLPVLNHTKELLCKQELGYCVYCWVMVGAYSCYLQLCLDCLLDNDWMMATCKCQGLQATVKIQNSKALYKGSNFVSSGELLELCRIQTKLVTHWWTIISEVTLIDQNTVYTCFHARKEIAVLCTSWHLWIISQPKYCSKWKEPGLVRYYFSGRVVYRQIRCDHFGHYIRMLYGW